MFLLRRSALRAVASSPSVALLSSSHLCTSTSSLSRLSLISLRAAGAASHTPAQRRLLSRSTAAFSSVSTSTGSQSSSSQSDSSRSTTPSASGSNSSSSKIAQQPSSATGPTASDATATTNVEGAASGAVAASPGPLSSTAGQNHLYVGNVGFHVKEEEIKELFEGYGEVESVRLVRDHRGLSRGFGYVVFKETDNAAAAIEALNFQEALGRRMVVQVHRQPTDGMRSRGPRNSPSTTLFIGNMSFEMSDKDLNDLFRDIKNVTDVRVAIDRRTGQPRGFAHADFLDVDSARQAMAFLSSKEIYGRRLRVDYGLSSQDRSERGSSPPTTSA